MMGIAIFASTSGADITVHDCDFYRTPSVDYTTGGIMYKHGSHSPSSYFNVYNNTFTQLRTTSFQTGTTNTHFHHNLIVDSATGVVKSQDFGGTTHQTNQTFEYNKANYIAQAKASLHALEGLFQLMKDHGIYDTSTILVVGDHGSGITKEMYVNPSDNSKIAVKTGITYTRDYHQDKSRGIPLILVKRRSSRGELATSDQPVSLLDVPATILADLSLEHDQAGQPMFSVDPESIRVRKYAAISFGGTKSDYLSPITVYSVSGHSWLDDSWEVSEVWLPPSTATRRQ